MGKKALVVTFAALALYTVAVWIVALKLIADFLFMLGGWVVR